MELARRARVLCFRAVAVAGGALLALGVTEAALRASMPDAPAVEGRRLPEELDAACAVTHPTRGWTMRAGACGRDAAGLMRTPPAPDAAAFTVLLEGDSVGEKAWAHALPDALSARLGRPVAVRNGAVSGYNTCQEADALRAHLAHARVDAVIVQTCANDLQGSVTVLPDTPGWSVVRMGQGWRRMPSRLLDLRLGQLALARAVASSGAVRLSPAGAARCASDIAARARSADIPLVVLHFPALVDPGEGAPALARLRTDEAAVREVWARVAAAQIDGRAALAPLGPLAALAPHDADRLHPRAEAAHPIADALAGPVAAALGVR